SARAPEDLFGDLGSAEVERARNLAIVYRRIAAVLHPDRHAEPQDKSMAHEAFVVATVLREQAERKIRAGTYGDGGPEPPAPTVVKTRQGTYTLLRLFARGDLCDLHECTTSAGERALFKIVRSSADNDLATREAEALGPLFPRGAAEEKFLRYLPRLVESFVVRGDSGSERRVNVVSLFSEHVSLTEVSAAYPDGLDFADVVWMLKRLLAALGWVHRQGLVHGAILPPHVLVHPIDHGARIVDWCYSREIGAPLRAAVKAHRSWYAPELLDKKPATPQADIHMAARCALALLDPKRVPRPLERFLATCVVDNPSRRPDDAWALHEELDHLLRRLVGRPKYRPLTIATSKCS
ncbi:MAG TPA: hypothetical protein VM580_22575, partial [Labilithrix sp.]|nr:hypothetical protein [Labilithrix sp.]